MAKSVPGTVVRFFASCCKIFRKRGRTCRLLFGCHSGPWRAPTAAFLFAAPLGCGGLGTPAVLVNAETRSTPTRTTMALRHEKVFTDEEFIAAFELILPPREARAEALAHNSAPDLHDFESATPGELAAAPAAGPRSYDGDMLDLLSLVSQSCAERAWRLMGVSPQEGAERREAFRRRIGPMLRKI